MITQCLRWDRETFRIHPGRVRRQPEPLLSLFQYAFHASPAGLHFPPQTSRNFSALRRCIGRIRYYLISRVQPNNNPSCRFCTAHRTVQGRCGRLSRTIHAAYLRRNGSSGRIRTDDTCAASMLPEAYPTGFPQVSGGSGPHRFPGHFKGTDRKEPGGLLGAHCRNRTDLFPMWAYSPTGIAPELRRQSDFYGVLICMRCYENQEGRAVPLVRMVGLEPTRIATGT